jgi:predicted ATP-dependent endonuclease of OLD family
VVIKSVEVRNFRCIAGETLSCDDLTVLAGPNGSGKSAFLRALEIFYTASPKVQAEDFYAEDTTKEIVIAVTFSELTVEEKKRFESYMQGQNLTVERVISLREGKLSAKYHGAKLQNPEFSSIREAEGAANKRTAYNSLRSQEKYQDLPPWTNQTVALEALAEWEAQHPEACSRQRDDGQFFGFTEVAQGYLGQFTKFLLVPAVRDASEDAAEGKGRVLSELMDLVVRSVLANKEEIKTLREETQARYDELVDPSKIPQLQNLGENLSATLRTYVPSARVDLTWAKGASIDIPLPKADVKLVEDGYPATVARTGHGLQRAFILTMLQHLAVAQVPTAQEQDSEQVKAEPIAPMPNLIIGIEEPELYQHPSRQRHLSKILMDLASGGIKGVTERTQIIYSTHSPLFVGIDRFDRLRLLRKVGASQDKAKRTRVVQTTLDDVAQEIWQAQGGQGVPYTGATLRPRLQAVMTPWMNEGFFADVVVLVEGEDDRAAILGMALTQGSDLESMGYAVIPCGGKSSLDRPLVIFRRLDIPVYVVWDGDKGVTGSKPEENRRLLRLLGKPEEDWPATQVTERFTCFETKLEMVLREQIGEDLFDCLIESWQEEFGVSKRDQALKNPLALQYVIEKAKTQSKTSSTLEEVTRRILALKGYNDRSAT